MIPRAAWPLVCAAEMRALDAHTIEVQRVPGELLMETAGHAVVERVAANLQGGEVVVVCGAGNNGGDGYVIARHLHVQGVPVRAIRLGEPQPGTDAAANLERARAAGVSIESELRLPKRGVVVDAIFGTGLAREITGTPAEAVDAINSARSAVVSVVSVDIASGVDSDTGQVLGCAVRADETVAISLPKFGHVLEPGRSRSGRLFVARIGIADQAPQTHPSAIVLRRSGAGSWLPVRPSDGHKGRFGHVLVAAGSEGKTGAAALAATAAGRSGAGLVTVACPRSLGDILEVKCTEAMTALVAETSTRAFSLAAEDAILELAADRDVLAIGPGIGREDETISLVNSIAKRTGVPLVIDADGLFAFSQDPGVLKAREAPTILTPHPGEAARLLGGSAADVNADRIGVAREIASLTGSVVLLKGAATVTADPSGRVAVNPTGGPALATGGTGDVLTGVVAALVAQGVAPFEAAAAAAYLHGEAADRCASRRGAAGILAGDVADELPAAARALRVAAAEDGMGRDDRDATGDLDPLPVLIGTLLPFP